MCLCLINWCTKQLLYLLRINKLYVEFLFLVTTHILCLLLFIIYSGYELLALLVCDAKNVKFIVVVRNSDLFWLLCFVFVFSIRYDMMWYTFCVCVLECEQMMWLQFKSEKFHFIAITHFMVFAWIYFFPMHVQKLI